MVAIKIQNLVSKKEIRKPNNTETLYLTKPETDLLWYIVKSQIQWGAGGCLNKGEEVDERKMKLAISILSKI